MWPSVQRIFSVGPLEATQLGRAIASSACDDPGTGASSVLEGREHGVEIAVVEVVRQRPARLLEDVRR